MTLRESLKITSYKSIFNCIYNLFYKEKGHSKAFLTEIDCSYLKFYKKLLSLSYSENSDHSIYLLFSGDDIDVCLLDDLNDEVYSLCFVDWSSIIDMKIINSVKISAPEYLARILWEMTFWGFTEQEVKKQESLMLEASNEIKTEKIINLWEPKWDIANDEKNSD